MYNTVHIKNRLLLGSRLLLTLLGKLRPEKHGSRCEVSRGTALTLTLFTLAQR